MNRTWLGSVALLGSVLCACGNGRHQATPTSSAASSAQAAASSKGLEAPDNDPEVTALANRVLGCPRQDNALKPDCPELIAWGQSQLFAEGKADRTLVNMIEDPRPEIRSLAAGRLHIHGKGYREDRGLADRVVAAAKAEATVLPAAHGRPHLVLGRHRAGASRCQLRAVARARHGRSGR